MFNLGATDTLEAIASVDAKISCNVSYVDGTTVGDYAGLVGNAQTTLITAVAATRVLSVTMSNTHTSAVTVSLSKDPADAGTLYHYFETVSLGVKYSLHFDGQRCTVLDASGNVQTLPGLHGVKHKTGGADPFLADPGAIGGATPAAGAFTTISASGLITATGGQIAFPATAVPSADPNTLDDYEEGTYDMTCIPITSGTVTVNPTNNLVAYTKIGQQVSVQGSVDISAVNIPVGNIKFLLPFTVKALGEGAGGVAGSLAAANVDFDAAAKYLSLTTGVGIAYFLVVEIFDNAGLDYIDGGDIAAADEYTFQLTYICTF